MKKLYLVDVSSLFFRAFYAVRPLTSPSGLPVNAIYGYLSMLIKLLKEERPDYIALCFDRKEPSFRKEIFSAYKANRTEIPEDLVLQMSYLKKIGELLGLFGIERAPYEADDLIGALTKFGLKEGLKVVIVSGDKDFAQLVKPGVELFDSMKDTRVDSEGVKSKWGVLPNQMIDYLAIVGDSSDNVPGVDGIGPKGAEKLLNEFGNLESIYARIEEIKSQSVREKLQKSKDQAFLARKLVTIVTDIPLDLTLQDLRLQGFKRDELEVFLRELDFKSFAKTLLSLEIDQRSLGQESLSPTVSGEQGAPLFEWQVKSISPDQVLQLLNVAEPLWVLRSQNSIYFLQGKVFFEGSADLGSYGSFLSELNPLWCGFDLKSLWHDLGVRRVRAKKDLMIGAYVVRGEDSTDLDRVIRHFLKEEESSLAHPRRQMELLLELSRVLESEIEARGLGKLYNEMDLPVAPILFSMEDRGIKVNKKYLEKILEEWTGEIQEIESSCHSLGGEVFNVASPKQLAVVLFEKLKLPAAKKTKTGYSTDNEVLQELDHPLAKKVLEYRELSKLKSTYVEALLSMADKESDRVHTQFNQALTHTGRLSSTSPNLQNIPIRTPRGQRVRRAFIAEPGNFLVSLDYSQIELRILAYICKDPGLISAFKSNQDIHSATAAEIFSVNIFEVSDEQRRMAKAVNFGIAYGQGAFGLSQSLGIPRTRGQEIIRKYFEKFPGVQSYIESTIKSAHETGFVETLFGRKRWMTELKSNSPMVRKFGERAAINAPIQGTAADLVKLAMIKVCEDPDLSKALLLQVHDELVFEIPEKATPEWAHKARALMESVVSWEIPLRVNVSFGKNWDESQDLGPGL